MGAFTPLKIIITEGAIGNVLQSLLKRYREGDTVTRSWYCPAVAGPDWKELRGQSPIAPAAVKADQRHTTKKAPGRRTAGPAMRSMNEPGGPLEIRV